MIKTKPNGIYTLPGTGTGTSTGNGIGTIGHNGFRSLSLSRSNVNTSA